MLPLPLVASISATPPLTVLPQRARGGALAKSFAGVPSNGEERWLDVPLDHANPGGKHLQIRYFVDDSHFDAANASSPIFLGMGGEGGTAGAYCISYHTTAVVDHKALCVAVEHRFYGQSVPADGGVSTDNYVAGARSRRIRRMRRGRTIDGPFQTIAL